MKPLYIVAVSGGVDSIVLLHQLVMAGEARLVVVHVDHGIRPDSADDAAFVRTCAEMYQLPFEVTHLALGVSASEERARAGRWQFLREVKDTHQAEKIVTAHHADDIVETMIINMIRGTGWRGIASLQETDEIKRPLLAMRKRQIVAYAQEHDLQWREDSTNDDQKYLRNRIRRQVIPRMNDHQFDEFMQLHARQLELRKHIEREVNALTPVLYRYNYIMWPDNVAHELLRALVGSLTRREFDQLLLFIRTARHQKRLSLSNGKILKMGVKQFIVLEAED